MGFELEFIKHNSDYINGTYYIMGFDQDKLMKYNIKVNQVYLLSMLKQIINEFDLETIVEDGKVYYNVSPAQVILDNGIFYIHSRSYANKIVKPLYEKKFIIKANKKVMRSDCFIRLNIEDLK